MTPNPPPFGKTCDGIYELRGKKITKLIADADFISTLWLTWTGRKLTAGERVVINACLVAVIDHGLAPPSTQSTRLVASSGKPLAESVAAGVLAFGPRHGNAAGPASVWLREALCSGKASGTLVDDTLTNRQKIPGFGHPVYEIDPRTVALFKLAKNHLKQTAHIALAESVRKILSKQKGKEIALNIDGALGAIIADLDIEPAFADALFLCGRTFGLAAHAIEAHS